MAGEGGEKEQMSGRQSQKVNGVFRRDKQVMSSSIRSAGGDEDAGKLFVENWRTNPRSQESLAGRA